MDSLERKVEILVTENTEYKKKIVNLEESNGSLVQQLQKLQKLLGLQATQVVSRPFLLVSFIFKTFFINFAFLSVICSVQILQLILY